MIWGMPAGFPLGQPVNAAAAETPEVTADAADPAVTTDPSASPTPSISPTPEIINPVTSISAKYTKKSIYPDKAVKSKTDLTPDDSFEVWIGDKITLYPTVLPEDATNPALTYTSSNETMAKVSEKGVVTIKAMGSATITAASVTNPEISISFEVHAYKNSIDIVSDLGAVPGDGVSDYSIIKKALAQAQYLKDGDTLNVNIPDGTYDIDGMLLAYSNTKLTLSDKTIIKRSTTTGNKHMLRSAVNEKIKGYDQIKNFSMSGGTWDGNADGSGTSDLLYFGHGQNITIKDTTVKNTCGEHLIELAGINNAIIRNVTLTGYKIPSSIDYYTPQKEAIQLDYCSSSSAPAMKPADNTACKNITISNCKISNYMCGIGCHGSTPSTYLENINILNNTFKNITNICIDARNFKNVMVEKNTATGLNEFFYSENSTGTIKSNTITNKSFSQMMTLYINTANGIELLGSEFTVSSNKITGQKANGVYIGTRSKVTLKSNKIKNSKKYGVYIYRATATIKSNTLSGNSKGVFYADEETTIKSSDDIRAYYIDLDDKYKYTGKAIKPIKKIKGLSKKYYSVSYKNNKKRGTATATIKGKGKVKKSRKLKFKIE